MPFWLLALCGLWCSGWRPSLSFWSRCWPNMLGLALCKAAADGTGLSSPGHARWFAAETWGRWPHMASSCLTKGQCEHALSAAGARRWWRLAGLAEHRSAGALECKVARMTADRTELGKLWLCAVLLGQTRAFWGFVLCCWAGLGLPGITSASTTQQCWTVLVS